MEGVPLVSHERIILLFDGVYGAFADGYPVSLIVSLSLTIGVSSSLSGVPLVLPYALSSVVPPYCTL